MAYATGDLVVLVSGSMRMAVESVEENRISVVWCNEGVIGRDSFAPQLLKKWEVREDGAGPRGDRGGDRGGKPFRGGDRDGGESKPRGKTGWDGKPREKKFFRKDG